MTKKFNDMYLREQNHSSVPVETFYPIQYSPIQKKEYNNFNQRININKKIKIYGARKIINQLENSK